MKTAEIRHRFIDYFKKLNHTVVPSSSLIPAHDPTLLFTNSGMVQFKDVFLGTEQRSYRRATSSQRCVRAGGKHNDLDNVGYTARHHTFFEMLGNFSFGDYFKREAIHYAWNFLTQELHLPPEKLWVTVYEEDQEAEAIWLNELNIDPKRMSRCGKKDNFWMMGDVGPCGPCTEIFYDHGPSVAGGPPGSPDAEGDRYIEIWNLVFMQFSRDAAGNLTTLPAPSVDTGMGLERIAAVMQGVHNNYDIDLFVTIIKAVREVLHVHDDQHLNSLRVLADHIRSTAFLIADGVLPSNEGRGYVLRRIIRRAIRHGHRLGAKTSFFYKLVPALISAMGDAYPELSQQKKHIEQTLKAEEEQFALTLDQGLKILADTFSGLQSKVIPGEIVFKLYDTYGFPADLTADVARELGVEIDTAGFDQAMEKQRALSKASQQFSTQALLDRAANVSATTAFKGYDSLTETARIIHLLNAEGQSVERLTSGQGMVVLDHTPFYAESGGQAGDQGVLTFSNDGLFVVSDTQSQQQAILHVGELKHGSLSVGDTVQAIVDGKVRQATALNHSATHLLHAALRALLGTHVQQKGSRVDSERLRFDFLHPKPLSKEEIHALTQRVNQVIRENKKIATEEMPITEAKASGAIALFGEKYADSVRVLSMGDFSKELCGGTHACYTGDIGYFKIISETGIAAGIRRIEAITGERAVSYVDTVEEKIIALAQLFKTSEDQLLARVTDYINTHQQLEKDKERLQTKVALLDCEHLLQRAVTVNGMHVLAARIEGASIKTLRDMMDHLKNKLHSAAIVLATVEAADKVVVLAGVTPDKISVIKAGDLVNHVAVQVGGRGGGRPELAQAGGNQPEALDRALQSVTEWVQQHYRL